ncbi:MAG: hypothetical protein ACRDN0_00405 [Trebonia sp.]
MTPQFDIATTAATSHGDTLSSAVPVVVTLAIILLLLVTRVRGRRLQPARLLVGPLVLIVIGIGSLIATGTGSSASVQHATALHGIDYLIGGVDLLDSLIVGTVRGFTIRLYQRDGVPWYRYGPVTVALWIFSILVRFALAILGSARHASPLTEGSDLLFMLGLALICQNVVVGCRHAQLQARPSHRDAPVGAALTGRPSARRSLAAHPA